MTMQLGRMMASQVGVARAQLERQHGQRRQGCAHSDEAVENDIEVW
jgi:hypothetical protein